jgi:hypothetical protein
MMGKYPLEMRARALVLLVVVAAASSCGTSRATGSPGASATATLEPGHAEERRGDFVFTFDLPKTTWRTTESITGEARLAYLGTIATHASTYGGGPISFWLTEVSGTRSVKPALLMSCVSMPITAATPITSGLSKSGGGDSAWADAFVKDPLYRLPAGEWDLRAEAWFEESGCSGEAPLTATIRLHIVP